MSKKYVYVHTVSSWLYFLTQPSFLGLLIVVQDYRSKIGIHIVSVVIFFTTSHWVKTLFVRRVCSSKTLLTLLKPCCPYFIGLPQHCPSLFHFPLYDPGILWLFVFFLGEIAVSFSLLKSAAKTHLHFALQSANLWS